MKLNKIFLSALLAATFISTASFSSVEDGLDLTQTGIKSPALTIPGASSVNLPIATNADVIWFGNREAGVLPSQARHPAYLPKDASLLGIATSLGISLEGKTIHQVLDEMKIRFSGVSSTLQILNTNITDLGTIITTADKTNSLILRLNSSVDSMINSYFSYEVLANTTVVFPGTPNSFLTNAPVSITPASITSDKYAVIRSGDRLINAFSSDGSTYQALYLTPAAKLSILLKAMFGITDTDFNTITALSQESGVILKNVLDVVIGTARDGSTFATTNPAAYTAYRTIGYTVAASADGKTSASGTASTGSFGTFKAIDDSTASVQLIANNGNAFGLIKGYAFKSYNPAINDDASLLRAFLMGIVGVPASS